MAKKEFAKVIRLFNNVTINYAVSQEEIVNYLKKILLGRELKKYLILVETNFDLYAQNLYRIFIDSLGEIFKKKFTNLDIGDMSNIFFNFQECNSGPMGSQGGTVMNYGGVYEGNILINVDYSLFYYSMYQGKGMKGDVMKIINHELIHFIDTQYIIKFPKVFDRWSDRVNFKKIEKTKLEIKKAFLVEKKFYFLHDLFDDDMNTTYTNIIFYVVELLRFEGVAEFASTKNFSTDKKYSILDIKVELDNLFNENYYEYKYLDFKELYKLGFHMILLIAYFYLSKEIEFSSSDITQIREGHLSLNLKNNIHVEKKNLYVNIFKEFNVNKFLFEYEKACDFFRVDMNSRIFMKRDFKKLRKIAVDCDSYMLFLENR